MSEVRKPTKWEMRGMSEQEYNLRELRGDWESPIEQLLPTVPEKINPFGKVHDYISVSVGGHYADEPYLVISDGTTTLRLNALIIEPASNHSKPHMIRSEDHSASMLVTHRQLQTVLKEYSRLFTREEESDR